MRYFEQKGLASQIFLRRKLVNLKFEEEQSMQSHINKVQQLSDQLEAIGDPVKDKDLAIITLCSMPEKYNSLIIALETKSPADITFDFVSGRLLAEEERQKEVEDQGSRNIQTAFYNRAERNGKSSGNQVVKPCSFCHRSGHSENSCWDKHGYLGGSNKQVKSGYNNNKEKVADIAIEF